MSKKRTVLSQSELPEKVGSEDASTLAIRDEWRKAVAEGKIGHFNAEGVLDNPTAKFFMVGYPHTRMTDEEKAEDRQVVVPDVIGGIKLTPIEFAPEFHCVVCTGEKVK